MAGPRNRPFIIGLLVAFIGALADQISKAIALETLSRTNRIPLLGDFLGLQLAFNPGTVMSLGANSTWVITLIAGAASIGLLFAAARVRTTGWAVAIGFILGGAVGNLFDRIFAPPGPGVGHVTDFLAYGEIFIGNLADIEIGIGVGIAILVHLRTRRANHSDISASQQDGIPRSR